MKQEKDYRKILDLISEASKITEKLIDLSDTSKDHFYSLRANIENDVWITEHHNKQISHLSQTIKEKHSGLVKQLDKIRKELNDEINYR